MKLQDQVCTLEQGLKLKKLGVTQASEYHHFCTGFHSDGNGDYPPKYIVAHHKNAPEGYVDNEGCSAFTVAELGVMLPGVDISKGEFMHFNKGSRGGHWFIDYSGNEQKVISTEGDLDLFEMKQTEAQARAAMLIYLLENELTTVDEVNERLAE